MSCMGGGGPEDRDGGAAADVDDGSDDDGSPRSVTPLLPLALALNARGILEGVGSSVTDVLVAMALWGLWWCLCPSLLRASTGLRIPAVGIAACWSVPPRLAVPSVLCRQGFSGSFSRLPKFQALDCFHQGRQ